MGFKDIKLRNKLFMAFVLVTLINALPLTINIYSLMQMRNTVKVSAEESEEAFLYKDLKLLIARQQLSENKYLLTGDPSYLEQDEGLDEEIEAIFNRAISGVEEEQEAEALKKIQLNIEGYEVRFREIEKLYQSGQREAAFTLLATEHKAAVEKVTQGLDDMVKDAEEDAEEAMIEAGEHSEAAVSLYYLSIAISVLSLVIAIVLAVFVSRSITRPIDILKEAADKISKGNMNISIDIDRKDEIGILAAAFKRMLTAVRYFAMELKKQKQGN